jgi:hypothetical protein
MSSTLLLTITFAEFLDDLIKWLPTAIVALGIYMYKTHSETHKAERDGICNRLEDIEVKQTANYPKFYDMIEDVKAIKERVHNHHENRFTGMVGQIELFSKLYDNKLEVASSRVDNLEKRFDKIDDKLDKILERIHASKTP